MNWDQWELIAVDPGENIGWARFNQDQEHVPVEFGTIKYHEFHIWLERETPNIWVVEDYVIRPKQYDHNFDKGYTLRVIGAIDFQAHRTGAVFQLQPANLKPGAYAQMGGSYQKGKRNMHHMDAIAHGSWYVNHKITKRLKG